MIKPYIYLVTNTVNGKQYVGQHDGSKKHYFASGTAINKAVKKYGKAAFKREIVVSGDFTKEELDGLEIHYITHFKTYLPKYPENGYNLTLGGCGKRGQIATPKTKQLISDNSANKRAVVQFDLQGNKLAKYQSLTEASTATGCQHSSIWRACDGSARQANSFLWLFASDYAKGKTPVLRKSKTMRRIAQYTCDGQLVTVYDSVCEAASTNEFNRASIANVLIGLAKTANGFQWLYIDQQAPKQIAAYNKAAVIADKARSRTRPVNMYSMDGIFMAQHESCAKAALSLGVAVSGVRMCILGKYKSCRGHVFAYAREGQARKRAARSDAQG